MDSDENNESIALITSKDGRPNYESGNKNNTITENVKIKSLSLLDIFFVILGFTMGTGILIVVYTIHQLGIILWIFVFALVFIIQTICSYLLHLCVRKVMDEISDGDETAIRDPYQLIAQRAGGSILRQFSVIMMYLWDISCVLSMLLVAASMPSTLFPIGSLDYTNCVRVWITIIICVITPIMYFGTYSDLKAPAYIAVTTSIISAVIIVINCIVKEYSPDAPRKMDFKPSKLTYDNAVEAISSFIFMTGGALTIPGLTVLAKKPQNLIRSLNGAYLLNFILFLLVGAIPYYVYNGHVLHSVIDTFEVTIKNDQGGLLFKTLTMVIQVLMLVHLSSASIFGMNPVFLHSEEVMNVPMGCNWKRIASRTGFMLFILFICLILPEFEFAISIAGGVPFAIMGILLPVYIYSVIFELNIYKKIFVYIFMTIVVLFIGLNLYISLKKIF